MFNKFKRIIKNKDASALIENFLSLSTLQLFSLILPLITLPYLLRVIGFEKYGTIVFSYSLIAYFTSVTDFSFRITATRDVAIFKNSPNKLNIIYSKVILIKTFFLLLSLLIIFLVVFFYPPFYENRLIYFYSSLLLVGYALFPEWFFQGIEKMKYISILNISIKLFFTLMVFLFIKKPGDFWVYPLSQSLGYIFAGLVGQYIMVRKYKVKFVPIKFKTLLSSVKSNIPIFINQFVPNIYNNTSTFFLGLMANSATVGLYQSILTVINILNILLETVSRVFFPFLNRKKNFFTKYAKLMLVLTTLVVLLAFCFKWLIFFYLNIKDTSISTNVYNILLIGIIGYSLYNIFGLNYFIVNRMDKLVMTNTLFFSIVGFCLSLILIYNFSLIGAAVSLSTIRFLTGSNLLYKWIKLETR